MMSGRAALPLSLGILLVVFCPPYEKGGTPNVREAGGCFARARYPPVSLREPSPLLHRGDTAVK